MDCKYCPSVPASYFCENCQIGFCLNCVPEDKRSLAPRCTLCRQQLVSFNNQQVVPDFWTQWVTFFQLPFTPSIFIALLIFAVIGLILPEVGMRALVANGIYWGLLVMMLFELSNQIAEGRTDVPPITEIWNKAEPFLLIRVLVQALFVLLLIFSIGNSFGDWAAVSLVILYGFGFPASILILALEKRFFSAVNPFRIIYVISAIRLPYLWLYGTWLITVGISYWLVNWQQDSHYVYTVIAYQISFYFWTAWFVMLGYATYQYHQQLGIAVFNHHKHHRHQQTRKKSEKVKSASVKEAEILVAEQRIEDALNLLHTAMDEPMAEVDIHRYYLKLLVSENDTKRLAYISKRLIRQFIHQGKAKEAAHIAVIVGDVVPDWQPELASDSFLLAKDLIKMSRRELALTLLNGLLSKTEDSELMADSYFLAAQLLAENFNRDDEAIDYLQRIVTDFPEQSVVAEAKSYLEILQSSLPEQMGDALLIEENIEETKGDAIG